MVVWLPTMVVFALFYVLLYEVYLTTRPVSPKVHLLLLFIAFLHAFLPLILSGVFSNGCLAVCSPLGYYGVLFDDRGTGYDWIGWAWLPNLFLCGLAYFVIQRRYKVILAATRSHPSSAEV